jgi:hypothetical protein
MMYKEQNRVLSATYNFTSPNSVSPCVVLLCLRHDRCIFNELCLCVCIAQGRIEDAAAQRQNALQSGQLFAGQRSAPAGSLPLPGGSAVSTKKAHFYYADSLQEFFLLFNSER